MSEPGGVQKWLRLISVSLLWEPRDLWVGVYWDYHSWRADREVGVDAGWYLQVYICVVPLLPIRLRFGSQPLPRRGGR